MAEYLEELTEEERRRVEDQGDAVEITLLEPITYKHSKIEGDRTLAKLRLTKKVKGKHMKALDQAKGEIGQSLALVAALAGVPAHAMDELDVRDLDVVQVVIDPFLPKSQRTGTP